MKYQELKDHWDPCSLLNDMDPSIGKEEKCTIYGGPNEEKWTTYGGPNMTVE